MKYLFNFTYQAGLLAVIIIQFTSFDKKTEIYLEKTIPEQITSSHKESSLPETVSFNEHIQPILSEYCYHCHGPDASTRKPGKEPYRLDLEEFAFEMRDSGTPVIIKGKPQESELIRLIRSKDVGEVMPPPESHKTMKPHEMALIEKWIEQGAEYQKHWAYEPIVRHAAPKNSWSDKPIDGFIHEKLSKAGLNPNPAEEARRFYRRLTLDLTGLPPETSRTEGFVAAYEADQEKAISQETDRLLASIPSAEHFAKHWLDAARYADTHGIHYDNYRAIWPYRDWVVRAFHSNMKWDQFTTEQLAGDLLPNRTLDQHIATGFLRSLSTTGEGGAIAEEYKAIYATDRVDTMSGIWLGLTASCASCHDHKFDPFSTKEFYQLTAFFRNNTMSTLDRNLEAHPPAIFAPIPADRPEWNQIQAEIQKIDIQLAERRKSVTRDLEAWIKSGMNTQISESDESLSIHLPLNESNGSIKGRVNGQPAQWSKTPTRVQDSNGEKAILASAADISLGNIGSFSRGDQISYGGFIQIQGDISEAKGSVVSKINPAEGFRGWDLYLDQGRIGAHIVDQWDQSAIKILSEKTISSEQWYHVMILFDGKSTLYNHASIYIDGKLVASSSNPNAIGNTLETNVPLRIGSREGGSDQLQGKVLFQDFRFYEKILSSEEIDRLSRSKSLVKWVKKPANQREPEEQAGLMDFYVTYIDPPSIALFREKKRIQSQEALIRQRGSTTLVFEEKKDSEAFAHVLTRGSYTNKGEKVFPNTPAMLPPMTDGISKDRIGLAQWLNDPKNPLPARVTMNRLWNMFFGTGIVESVGDFGIMGSRPSHPKLLDWLASEFIASGWDFRAMAKTIVLSKAYRQSASISPDKLEKDYANRLISRGPRLRLDAEQLRDLSLAASGALSQNVGGAPVKPYQPEGIWESVAMAESNTKAYKQDHSESLYRRSIYTFWKRTAPHPSMEIFDAPTREVSCLKRERSNTPLQALALMNDPQHVEAGRLLAIKAMVEKSHFDERIDLISQRLISRKLDQNERAIIQETYNSILPHYTSKPEEALKALSIGESKTPENLPKNELATWSVITNQIFNLDETLTR